jgi:hypothetical protein
MKKIYLETRSNGVGFQLIDKWFAYRQSLSSDYRADISVSTQNISADLTILCDYFFDNVSDKDLKTFDILLCCNGGEPIAVASTKIKKLLEHDNCFMICNSLTTNLSVSDHLIWYPHNIMNCRDYWTRYFYPQPYENAKNFKINRKSTLFFINGKNVAWRDYFVSLIRKSIPDLKIQSIIYPSVTKVQDSQWESPEDLEFREFVNSLYPGFPDPDESENYYSNSVIVGIDDKFGKIPPGYFILPQYYENSCVIFPETSWQNEDLCLTEKSLKCFYAGSLPFPIGGSRINFLYNKIGFYTAYNLLPENLKMFDGMENHQQRYGAVIEAIKWLHDNPKIFESDDFQHLTRKNFENFMLCSADYHSVKQFDNLIKSIQK